MKTTNLKDLLLRLVIAGVLLSTFTFETLAADKTTSKQTTSAKASKSAKVDINSASQEELETLPGVGASTAKKIVSNRPYSSVSDLKKAGLSSKQILKLQPMASAKHTSDSTGATAAAPSTTRGARAQTQSQTSSTAHEAAGGENRVWVNPESKIYHLSGDRWYGKTKGGSYMTEKEAIAAGYRESKQSSEK